MKKTEEMAEDIRQRIETKLGGDFTVKQTIEDPFINFTVTHENVDYGLSVYASYKYLKKNIEQIAETQARAFMEFFEGEEYG